MDRHSVAALVVGLGNPGSRYSRTRHNAGRLAVDAVVFSSEVTVSQSFREGTLALLRNGATRFLALQPDTFMNNCGVAVGPVLRYYGLGPADMLVLHDDIDIPLGEVREKQGGGTGGHRGLESLVQTVGSGEFARIRIGVGRPPAGKDAADYVLEPFAEDEQADASSAIELAAELAVKWLRELPDGE